MKLVWDKRFAGKDYVYGTKPSLFLRTHRARLEGGGRALAVADGEGRNGVFLAEQGLDVVSMDSSPNAQRKAERLAVERGVPLELALADIASWPWTEAEFDLVAGIFIQFMGSELRAEIFAGMKRTVRPGGLVLVHGYTPKQLDFGTGGPGRADNLYTVDMLAGAFADFDILELSEYEAELDEGAGHSGRSALVDLVARRPGA